MRRFTREPESRDNRIGVRDGKTSSQVSGTRHLAVPEEEEGEDVTMDVCDTPYMPIRRNSRFYSSMRVRNKHRRDRQSSREANENPPQTAGE
ncbi:hypothetical protein FKM82_030231 [Ascaphus truei]